MRKSSDCHGAAGAGRRGARAAVALLVCTLGGCSVSMPLAGFIDNDPTGSVKAPLPEAGLYDPADWKQAEPALARVLTADAGDEPAGWANPDTGRKGRVAAVAAPFKREGSVCRALIGRIEDGEKAREWQGVGCRDGERVVLQDVSPWRGL